MRWLIVVVSCSGLLACARIATLENGAPGKSRCPTLAEIEDGALSEDHDECESGEACVERDFACRCDIARGGYPRPNSWGCHRAKNKADGCPDDDVLLGHARCTTEGQRCPVPRECGCDFFTDAVCREGRWTEFACTERCRAP